MSNLISPDHDFMAVVQLIESARQRVSRAVNTELIDLYWAVGEYVSQKLSTDAWGKGTVEALADYIQRQQPGFRGFVPCWFLLFNSVQKRARATCRGRRRLAMRRCSFAGSG